MSQYQQDIDNFATLKAAQNGTWEGINPEFAARMKVQNRFKTGLDIARYTASIMRKDMAEYDADSSQYTLSLIHIYVSITPTAYETINEGESARSVPTAWRIQIPEKDIDLSIRPFKESQWNNSCLLYTSLADEPTGNLDETTSETVSDLLFKTCKEANTSLVVVTHSQDVAVKADAALRLHRCV